MMITVTVRSKKFNSLFICASSVNLIKLFMLFEQLTILFKTFLYKPQNNLRESFMYQKLNCMYYTMFDCRIFR